MTAPTFALYDAFSDRLFGGSQACIIRDAASVPSDLRPRIAREFGLPATCFLDAVEPGAVRAQFFSTVMEQPMCGHGTVCLIADCLDRGLFCDAEAVELRLPAGVSRVAIDRSGERPAAMLEVRIPDCAPAPSALDRLVGVLGLETHAIGDAAPVEIVRGDFIHLVAPLRGLGAMRAIRPDFPAIVSLCHDIGVETVTVFCLETERPESTVHVRDFCPAVGVAESSSAGTTNAALAAYLLRHGIVSADADGAVEVRAEQGLEIGRPSAIRTIARLRDGALASLEVGGVATKFAEGVLQLREGADS